jgi:hypothetical protein
MNSALAKTVEKGPAVWTEEPVKDVLGIRTVGGAYDTVMKLHRSAGNRAVTNRLRPNSSVQLDPQTREEMESKFGAEFGGVRIHRDETAAQTALAAGARAITTGHDIVFGPGYYAPATREGKRLIAHELAHVLQQRRRGDRMASRAAAETEARQAGEDVASDRGASVLSSAAAGPQADPMPVEEKKEKKDADNGWSPMGDSSVEFWISHQVAFDASFNTVGAKSSGSPGFGAWTNQRVFTISEGEHTWLHLNFHPDSIDHAIPAAYRDQIGVFTDVNFTPANGGPVIDWHFRDDKAKYQTPGMAVSISLGSTRPGQSDLPVCDLPLDGGGKLIWKAGFNFGTGGGIAYEVKETFSLQSAVAAPPQSTGGTGPGGVGGAQASGAQGQDASKGQDANKGQDAVKGQGASKGQPPLGGSGTPSPAATKKPPPESVARINELTEAIKKTQDAVKKDPLVRALRDELAKIQPFMPQKDAKKAIDEAIDSLVKTGADELIKAILRGILGKDPTAVTPGAGPRVGPQDPRPFPSPQVKIPLPLPFDKPAPVRRHNFDYRDLHNTYAPGEAMKFTVLMPDDFSTISGAKRVVIVAEKDQSEPNPEKFGKPVVLESRSPAKVEFTAPSKPGKYVVRVDVGLGPYTASEKGFEVKEAKSK